jgi:hypothetical protein
MYKVQFSIDRIAHSLIPFRHRQLRFVAWVKVMVSYLAYLKEQLHAFWDDTVLDVSMTPQVSYLEKRLNLACNRTDIFINEGYTVGPWIFRSEETADPEFYMDQSDSYVFSQDDAVDVDFVVNIPEIIVTSAPLIAALTHKYKIPGMDFIIQKF